MDVVQLTRTGRITYLVHEPWGDPPSMVEKWLLHEKSILVNLTSPGRLRAPSPPRRGAQWVVWRLLSGNNREIARGVGAFATLDAARVAAVRAVALAHEAQSVFAFDRRSAHSWCLQADATPLLIGPTWHRSRRTNRLNLEVARITLGTADTNGGVTMLDRRVRA